MPRRSAFSAPKPLGKHEPFALHYVVIILKISYMTPELKSHCQTLTTPNHTNEPLRSSNCASPHDLDLAVPAHPHHCTIVWEAIFYDALFANARIVPSMVPSCWHYACGCVHVWMEYGLGKGKCKLPTHLTAVLIRKRTRLRHY